MKRFGMLIVGVIGLGLAACGGEQPVEKDAAGATAQKQALVTVACGGVDACPSGTHAAYWECSSSCPGYPCTTGPNAFACNEDSWPYFTTCGTSCPSEYHVGSTWTSSDCGTTWPNAGGPAISCIANNFNP